MKHMGGLLQEEWTLEQRGLPVQATRCMVSGHQVYGQRPPGVWSAATRCMVSGHQVYGQRPPGVWSEVTRCMVSGHQVYGQK